METTVKWRWRYRGVDNRHVMDSEVYHFDDADGEFMAGQIIQNYLNECGYDSFADYAIDILEPEQYKGVYDVKVDYQYFTKATKREEELE